MNHGSTYRLRDNDIAAEDFDGEAVVLDLESGKYFSLSTGAAAVWNAIVAGQSIESLCASLPDNDERRVAIAQAVSEFLDHKLLVESDATAAASPAPLPHQASDFTIAVYDDLADLLVADPIHDVDEAAGWPNLPPRQES